MDKMKKKNVANMKKNIKRDYDKEVQRGNEIHCRKNEET